MPEGKGIALILGAPKPPDKAVDEGNTEEDDQGLYDVAGKDLLQAIKAEDGRGIAEIVAEICRMAKGDDY